MTILAVNVAILFSEGNEVLLLKRKQDPYAGWWSFPGGKLKQGEPLREGVRREIREETALEIREPLLRVLLNERYYEEARLSAHFLLFYWEDRHRVSLADMQKISTSEEGELSWFAGDTLPDRFVPSDRRVLEHILREKTSQHLIVFDGSLERIKPNELILREWAKLT